MEQKTSKNVPKTRQGSLRDEAQKMHMSHTSVRRWHRGVACLHELERQIGKELFGRYMMSQPEIWVGHEPLYLWASMAHHDPELGKRVCTELLDHRWEYRKAKQRNDYIRHEYALFVLGNILGKEVSEAVTSKKIPIGQKEIWLWHLMTRADPALGRHIYSELLQHPEISMEDTNYFIRSTYDDLYATPKVSAEPEMDPEVDLAVPEPLTDEELETFQSIVDDKLSAMEQARRLVPKLNQNERVILMDLLDHNGDSRSAASFTWRRPQVGECPKST